MWATLHAFEHNNLDGTTLIPAPKYGHTLLRSWARSRVICVTDDVSPTMSAPNVPISNYGAGLAERVTTV